MHEFSYEPCQKLDEALAFFGSMVAMPGHWQAAPIYSL